MTDLSNPADVRFLLKKLWCHGQLVAPIQACLYAYWAVTATDAQVLDSERVLLLVSASILPIWGYVSWTRMKQHGIRPVRVILGLGILMEIIHICVVIVASQRLQDTANLILFIVTILHVIETFMYLLAIYCLRHGIVDDDTPESKQTTLLGV